MLEIRWKDLKVGIIMTCQTRWQFQFFCISCKYEYFVKSSEVREYCIQFTAQRSAVTWRHVAFNAQPDSTSQLYNELLLYLNISTHSQRRHLLAIKYFPAKCRCAECPTSVRLVLCRACAVISFLDCTEESQLRIIVNYYYKAEKPILTSCWTLSTN